MRFYSVPDIQTATVVSVLKYFVLRMNLCCQFRGHCFDGAANMKKTTEEIKAIEPKALYLHCCGNSLNLAVSVNLLSFHSDKEDCHSMFQVCVHFVQHAGQYVELTRKYL